LKREGGKLPEISSEAEGSALVQIPAHLTAGDARAASSVTQRLRTFDSQIADLINVTLPYQVDTIHISANIFTG